MNSSLVLVVAALFLICSPLLANGRGQGQNSLINQICMRAYRNEDNCMAFAKVADPKITQAKTYRELAEAVLAFAVSKSKEGQAFLKGLAELDKSPAIEMCANSAYDTVMSCFGGALRDLKVDDLLSASYGASVAVDGPGRCNQGLLDANISNPAITAINREVYLLSEIASDAIDHISG